MTLWNWRRTAPSYYHLVEGEKVYDGHFPDLNFEEYFFDLTGLDLCLKEN